MTKKSHSSEHTSFKTALRLHELEIVTFARNFCISTGLKVVESSGVERGARARDFAAKRNKNRRINTKGRAI